MKKPTNKKRWIPLILLIVFISGAFWLFRGGEEAGVPIIVRTPKLEMELDKIEKDPLPLDIQVERR